MVSLASVQQAAIFSLGPGAKVRLRLPRILMRLLVASFFSLFLVSAWQFLWQTGSPIGLAAVIANTLLVICFLSRRDPSVVAASRRHWLVASLTQILPLLIRPSAGAGWTMALVAAVGQLAGLSIMVASLLALNRSIGIIAANRGVKTSGPYAWVRHPLYAGEITFFVSFLLGNLTLINALLVLLLIAGQLTRISQEETLLLQDDTYGRYWGQVTCRLIPGIL